MPYARLWPLLVVAFSLTSAQCWVSPAFADGNTGMVNGLPPTRLDSFVDQAQEYKELIYGDESLYGPPPYLEFEQSHRINAGIVDVRDQGLTTGHGSIMPDAWGKDEFIGGTEWSLSGAQGLTTQNMADVNGQPERLPSVFDLPQYQDREPADMVAMNAQQFPTGSVIDNDYLPIPEYDGQGDMTTTNGTVVASGTGDETFRDGTVLIQGQNEQYPQGTIILPNGMVLLPQNASQQQQNAGSTSM